MPRSGRWLLRIATTWIGETAILLRGRGRWTVRFAGLWERWRDPSGQWVKSCSILTTTPNAVTANVHDRMPVILDRDNYDLWLDPGMTNVQVVSELLKPYDAQSMRCYPVSSRVNHAANDDEDCLRPVEFAHTQNRLFS